MDYEKLYKKALERVKVFLKRWECVEAANSSLVLKEVKDIFPEFKESEDEKIRKEIISALKWANHKGVYDKHIAWLEKKGEQDATETQSEEFDDNIITSDDEILQAISIGLTDIIEDFGWSDFGGLPIEEIQDWLEEQGGKGGKK